MNQGLSQMKGDQNVSRPFSSRISSVVVCRTVYLSIDVGPEEWDANGCGKDRQDTGGGQDGTRSPKSKEQSSLG